MCARDNLLMGVIDGGIVMGIVMGIDGVIVGDVVCVYMMHPTEMYTTHNKRHTTIDTQQ